MLPFLTMVEMQQVTAAGIVRRCAVPAHPEPCTEIDIQCDRAGQHMLTLSRDKDKDSSDRSDDCVVAIWDVDTLAVAACIMDPDDYKNLVCAIQPKGGLIAVGGVSDIKVRACQRTRRRDIPSPHAPKIRFTPPRPAPRCASTPAPPPPPPPAPSAPWSPWHGRRRRSRCWRTRAGTAGTGTCTSASQAGDPRQIKKTIYWFCFVCFDLARAAGAMRHRCAFCRTAREAGATRTGTACACRRASRHTKTGRRRHWSGTC